MNTLTDLIELSLRCLHESAAGSRTGLLGIVGCGPGVGVFSWMLCGATMRLWNRSFHLKIGHHAVCAAAGIFTVLLAALLLGCGFFQSAAQSAIRAWRERLANDTAWHQAIFVDLFEQVRK